MQPWNMPIPLILAMRNQHRRLLEEQQKLIDEIKEIKEQTRKIEEQTQAQTEELENISRQVRVLEIRYGIKKH